MSEGASRNLGMIGWPIQGIDDPNSCPVYIETGMGFHNRVKLFVNEFTFEILAKYALEHFIY